MFLSYTSMGFATVVLHAHAVRDHVVHALFLCLLPLSVLNHARYYEPYPGKRLVYATDALLAATIPFYGMATLPPFRWGAWPVLGFWACIVANFTIYPTRIMGRHGPAAFRYHALMHTLMVAGAHFYLAATAPTAARWQDPGSTTCAVA